ncbi:MAG: hypothetical protein ACYS76_02795 [Planctomycetota bacterium]
MRSGVSTENSRKLPEPAGCDASEGVPGMSVVTAPGAAARGCRANGQGWRLNRQVNVSVLVQLVLLASLIVGSWVNLQRQLDLLQRDVTYLCECQKNFERKLESLHEKSISYEYRLRAVEKCMPAASVPDRCLRP